PPGAPSPRGRRARAGPAPGRWRPRPGSGPVEELGALGVELLGDRLEQGRVVHEQAVLVDERARVPTGLLDDRRVGEDAQQPQGAAAPGLGGSEDVALTALFEDDLGQLEAVGGGLEGPQAGHRRGVLDGGGPGDARAGAGTAADAAAQL